MDWVHTLTIIGVNIALMGAMSTWIVWAINKVDSDVKSIGNRIDGHAGRLDGHANRIDQLYKMYCDLHASQCEMQKDFNKKFYELLTEIKK